MSRALLERAEAKASPRRFSGEAITGFNDLDEAQQVAVLIRDMRDPTHEQLQTMLGSFIGRLDSMERSGHYTNLDAVLTDLESAHHGLTRVECLTDGGEEA